MSYIFTNNMILLRSLTWYSNKNYYTNSSSSSSGFVDTDGNTLTGYYIVYSTYANGYSASILANNPKVYVSSDKTALSRDDYAIPDDAFTVNWYTQEESVVDDDGISAIVYAYYTNETDSDITINKVLIVSSIGTSSSSSSGSSRTALLFEELLDEPVTIKAGERWARNFEFRLEVA